MVILDTNILIDALSGEHKAINAIKAYGYTENVAITILNKYELIRGKKFFEQHMLEELLSNLNVYGLNDVEIGISAEIYRNLKERGKLIDEFDILIAGIAIANNEKLVTSDTDFKEIKKIGYNNIDII